MKTALEPGNQALLDYWYTIRDDAVVPDRAAFKPADVRHLLPHLMLLEYRGHGALIYRLIGNAIVDKLGTDFTGLCHLDIVPQTRRLQTAARYRDILAIPCGMSVHRALRTKYGAAVVLECLYLPLRDRRGAITQLIGSANVIRAYDRQTERACSREQLHKISFIDLGAGTPAITPQPIAAA